MRMARSGLLLALLTLAGLTGCARNPHNLPIPVITVEVLQGPVPGSRGGSQPGGAPGVGNGTGTAPGNRPGNAAGDGGEDKPLPKPSGSPEPAKASVDLQNGTVSGPRGRDS